MYVKALRDIARSSVVRNQDRLLNDRERGMGRREKASNGKELPNMPTCGRVHRRGVSYVRSPGWLLNSGVEEGRNATNVQPMPPPRILTSLLP